jgi:hypothetical protein
VHVKWKRAEKKAIVDNMGHLLRDGRVPGKKECEECIEKAEGVLDTREWQKIKYWVKNQITKRQRNKK